MFNPEKMFTYIRGFAEGAQLPETQLALSFARDKHYGQMRNNGDPYIIHPLTMVCNAVSLGIRDDAVIATILLHDVCEDCDVTVEELPVSEAVRHSIGLVTFSIMDGETKEVAKNRYYNMIIEDRAATLTKLFDRCHNVSSMAGIFSHDRLLNYIDETRTYVLPLIHRAKNIYSGDSSTFFSIRYHIESVLYSIEATMRVYEAGEVQGS